MRKDFKAPGFKPGFRPQYSTYDKGGRVGKATGGGFTANDLLILKRHKYKPSEVAKWKDKGKGLIKVLKNPNP